LAARPDARPVAVLDQEISGNRVLHDVVGQNALARFDRDVLAWPGLNHVIILEGINDIGFSSLPASFPRDGVDASPVTADQIIAGYRQLIARARRRHPRHRRDLAPVCGRDIYLGRGRGHPPGG